MRAISLDLIRVTEAAAIASSKWVGSGDKEAADKAATDAMRSRLNRMNFSAQIIIGEGLKDESYGLFDGEKVGKFRGQNTEDIKIYDIAVDPIDGTRPTVTSGPEAMSVMSVGEKDSFFHTKEFYMNKMAYGPKIANQCSLTLKDPIEKTLDLVSSATKKELSNIVVCILDRPRHTNIIKQLREIGVKIKLIQDCDVSGAIAACLPDSGIDLLYGIGGAPESVITAAAIKCLKGGFEAQLTSKTGEIIDEQIFKLEELVKGPCVFVATGITDGSLLKGVRHGSKGAITNSVFMRSESGTTRWLTTYHGN